MKQMNNEAVSPVVGVMLMLVVTIIIAAVVSAFAGGLASDEAKAPQATLEVTPMIEGIEDTNKTNYDPDYPTGWSAGNGLLFEHKGGDAFSLGEIYVQIQSEDTKIKIGLDDVINATPTYSCLPIGVTDYLMEVGDDDGFIRTGDKFMLYADSCYDATEGTYMGMPYPMDPCISWKPENALGGKSVFLYTKCDYKIIDKASGKVIQTGTFVLQ
jgi:hypothetical protein